LNLLVLSPHRDDAAFSLSLAISRWLAEGHKITILNVFTRSQYAPYSDADTLHENDRMSYVSAMRRREDESFLKQMRGLAMIDLNVKDAPIRLHCDSSVVCDLQVDPADKAIPKIARALAQWTDAAKGMCAMVLPLGLGHHVDHRVARDAALPLTNGLPCAFYEELPYALREGVRVDLSRFREDTVTRFPEALHPVLCHGTHTHPAEFKRRMALLYTSQIDAAMAQTIANFVHRYQGGERLWANAAWLKIAAAERLSTRQRDEEAQPLPA
jgi:LmbE family N-acetylglucosaminyl deacetylase